jgi:hypothetical protein
MLDHTRFSSLLLSRIFSAEHLAAYPYYTAPKSDGDFDTEYMSGSWHEALIDGVQFFYPAFAGAQLGIVELWGAGCMAAAAVRDRPEPLPALLVPSWSANANRILEALELPLRMGSDEHAVRSLATGRVHSAAYPNAWYDYHGDVARSTLTSLAWVCRTPSVYHMLAVVHAAAGMLSFAVRRPDLIRANEHEVGMYDRCVGTMFDES